MKILLATALAFMGAAISRAGPADSAILAAMELAERSSYSWTTNVTDDARVYTIEGKTVEGGYTWQRLPMVTSIARRLGREAEADIEAIFKSPSEYVIYTVSGWKTLEELPKRHPDWRNDDNDWLAPAAPLGNPFGLAGFGAPANIFHPVFRSQRRSSDPAYSNAQFALSLPHNELAVIVSSFGELQVDGDIATGTLTDVGARLLLVREGQDHIEPVIATGRFKLWMSDGLVVKYALKLAGVMVVDRETVGVRQSSTTRLTKIGTTTFRVPEDASRRLGR